MANELTTVFSFDDREASRRIDATERKLISLDARLNNLGGNLNIGKTVSDNFISASRAVDTFSNKINAVGKQQISIGKNDATLNAAISDIKRLEAERASITRQSSLLIRNVRKEETKALNDEVKAQTRNFKRELSEIERSLKQPTASGNANFSSLTGQLPGGSLLQAFAVGGGIGAGIAVLSEAITLTKQLTSATVDLGVQSVNLAADFQSTVNSLAVFSGNTASAKRELADIDKIARETTGLRLEDAEKGYQRLRALGFQAEISGKLLKGLGIQRVLSGADAGAVDRVITNITQLTSGAGTAADVRQLIGAIPSLRATFKDAFGTADFGKINQLAADNPADFIEKFTESLAKSKQAIPGLTVGVEKLKDSAIEAGRAFGEPFLEPLTKDAISLTQVLQENRQTFKDWGETAADSYRGIIELGKLAGSVIQGTAQSLTGVPDDGFFGGLLKGILQLSPAGIGQTVREQEAAERVKKGLSLGLELQGDDPLELNQKKQEKALKERQKLLELTKQTDEQDIANRLAYRKAVIAATNPTDVIGNTRRTLTAEIEAARQQIRSIDAFGRDSIKNLSSEDAKDGKGLEIARKTAIEISKINTQIAISSVNAQAQINAEIEKGKEKVKELGKTYTDTFSNIFTSTSSNPFFNIFNESDKAIDKLRENLKGLSPELRTVAEQLQRQSDSVKLFDARLNNNLDAFDLREKANEFRNFAPETLKIDDPSKFFKDFVEAGLKQIEANNGGFTRFNVVSKSDGSFGGFSQSDARNSLLKVFQTVSNADGSFGGFFQRERTFADLTTGEKQDFLNRSSQTDLNKNISFQSRLDKQFQIIDALGTNGDAEKAALANQKILALAGTDPSRLSDRQREQVAVAAEREAARRDSAEREANKKRDELLAVNRRVAEATEKLLAVAEKEGFAGVIRVIDETKGGVESQLQPAPNSNDQIVNSTFFRDAGF